MDNIETVKKTEEAKALARAAITAAHPMLNASVLELAVGKVASRLLSPSGQDALMAGNLGPYVEQARQECAERVKFEADLERKRAAGLRWP